MTGGHRRFFDVGDLAGVRVEDPEVFAVTHAKVFELVGAGLVDGVRVDHIDGLAEPARYLNGCVTPASSTSGSRRSSRPASHSGRGPWKAPRGTSS